MFLQLSLHFVWEMNAWGGMIFWRSRAWSNLVSSLPQAERVQPGREKLTAHSCHLPKGLCSVLVFGNLSPEIQQQGQPGWSNWSCPCHLSLSAPLPEHPSSALPPQGLSPLLLAPCSWPMVGITYRRVLEDSPEVFGLNGMGWQRGKQIRGTDLSGWGEELLHHHSVCATKTPSKNRVCPRFFFSCIAFPIFLLFSQK